MTPLVVMLASLGIADLSRHAPPPLDVPPAGSWFVDPVFGTNLYRVTDAQDGTLCTHAYSYWPAFNADSTRLLVECDGRHLLYRWDGPTLVPDGTLEGADGPRLQFEGASWARNDPDTLYALEEDGTRLWRVDVSQRGRTGYTLVRDFAGLFSYPFVLWQLQVAGDHVFTFHSRAPDDVTKLDAVAYEADTNETWVFDRQGWVIDETKIDKLGRVVIVDGGGANPGFKLWDFRAGTADDFAWQDPDDKPGGHYDMGATVIANSDGWQTGMLVRRYDALHGAANLDNVVQYLRADGSLNWTIADHVSLRADDETWLVGSTYLGDGTYEAFEDEIYLARSDGGGFVRLAHTRSVGQSYYSYPRAVIDRSGRWVVFASDLGSSQRIDVMLLEVPADYRPPGSGGWPDGDPGSATGEGQGSGDDLPSGKPMVLVGCAIGAGEGSFTGWMLLAALVGLRRPSRSRARCRRDRTAA